MRRVGIWIVAVTLTAGLFTPTSEAQAQGHSGRRVIEKVPAVYPHIALENHILGAVKLEVCVRENGSVKSAKALGGNPLLIDTAKDAVRRWRFEPAPQETTEIVQVAFGIK
jgi:TonB family protein